MSRIHTVYCKNALITQMIDRFNVVYKLPLAWGGGGGGGECCRLILGWRHTRLIQQHFLIYINLESRTGDIYSNSVHIHGAQNSPF